MKSDTLVAVPDTGMVINRLLDSFAERMPVVDGLINDMWDDVQRLKELGVSYSELEEATGISRRSLQKIVAGGRPALF